MCFPEELKVVEDVVQKLQNSYEKTKDLKADFIQEANIKSIKKTETEEGKVFLRIPGICSGNIRNQKGKSWSLTVRWRGFTLPMKKLPISRSRKVFFNRNF